VKAERPVPIFVLGLQRSGTTWIANMLAGSGAVTAIAAPEHQGVHESIFFSHFARNFGPFDDPESRHAFHEAFAQSDYFRLTGLDPVLLTRIIEAASGHAEVFQQVMDAVAIRDGHRFWLEKSPHHTGLAHDLATDFPTARFLCVMRNSDTLIASRLAAYGRTPGTGPKRKADILRGAMVNALYRRRLTGFLRTCDRAMAINYDAFAAAPDQGRARIVEFLGLGADPARLVSAFAANSSHIGRKGTQTLSRSDRVALRAGERLGQSLPLNLLARIEGQRKQSRGADWPDWVWAQTGYRPER